MQAGTARQAPSTQRALSLGGRVQQAPTPLRAQEFPRRARLAQLAGTAFQTPVQARDQVPAMQAGTARQAPSTQAALPLGGRVEQAPTPRLVQEFPRRARLAQLAATAL
jgi:hypothetical protein